MTTFEPAMSHPYTSDTSFEDFSSMNGFKSASPHTGFSPALGTQEFTALLDTFTNTPGEDYSSSLFAQQQQQQPTTPYFAGSSYDSFNPNWTMSTDSQSSSFGQTDSSYSPKSSILSSDSSGMPHDSMPGINVDSSGQQDDTAFDPMSTTSFYSLTDSLGSSHRPNSQTVPYLEAIAAAPSSSMAMSYSQPEHPTYNPSSSSLSRQESTRSFLEGPHLSGLTLNSPRNSISAGSSTPSSSQNSPTTPLSAYSSDLNLSFQPHQQHYLTQTQNAGMMQLPLQAQQQPSSSFIPYANAPTQNTQEYVAGNALSMSVPASFTRPSPYENNTARSQLQASARPHGRMSSAGLMDQIVSSRQVMLSPNPEQENLPTPQKQKTKKGLRSRSASKTSPTPPATPGRSGLRASKQGLDPVQLDTILSGHTTPTEQSATRQTPSSAGPHRTPSKRTLSYESVPQQATTPAAATTPRRPSTLRRTASHTPGAATHEYVAQDGLASPANLQASHRAQNAAQFALASAMAPAQKARIAASANLEFPSGASGAMSRAQSSPGYALSGPYHQQTPAQPAMSPVNGQDAAKRRSNTVSLHMSPLDAGVDGRAVVSAMSSHPVSFAEALLALDQVTSFLNHQASFITSQTNQTVGSVLGTYEQLQAIEDLKRRVQNKLSFTS